MKKLNLLMLLLLGCLFVYSQKSKISAAASALSSGKLDKAVECIDNAINNPSTSMNPKAYFVKGQIYQKIAESPKNVLKLMKVDNIENAATIAYDAFQTALKYDKKGKLKKKINEKIKTMPIALSLLAQNKYEKKDFAKATELFLQVAELNKKYNNLSDTSSYFNAAICAEKANSLPMAETLYKRLLNEFNYKPEAMYSKIAGILKKKGDIENSNKFLQEGFKKFPKSTPLLYEIINYYLASNKSDNALEYIDQAIILSPNNSTLYQAKASLFDKLGKTLEAENLYKKAVEVKPDDFNARYNLAFYKSGQVAKKIEALNEIVDNNLYKTEKKKTLQMLKECIPYFVDALALKPDNKDLLKGIKEIYFTLRDESPEMMEKYEEFKKKLSE